MAQEHLSRTLKRRRTVSLWPDSCEFWVTKYSNLLWENQYKKYRWGNLENIDFNIDNLKNIDINLKNIDINKDMAFLENKDIDIDKGILQHIDID